MTPSSRHAELELLKWIALVAMAVDHAGKTLWLEYIEQTHFVGRLALPLFALIIGARLAESPHLAGRYLRRLAVFGVVAQPAFAAIAGPGRANIMFTLGLGVAVDLAVRHRSHRRVLAFASLPLLIGLGAFCEFGPFGVIAVPVLAGLSRWRPGVAALACGPVAFVAGGAWSGPGAVLNAGAFAASAIAMMMHRTPVVLPRPSRWVFYGFYPAHLYLLAALDVVR